MLLMSSNGIFRAKKYEWIADCKANKGVSTKYTPEQVEDFKRGFLCKGIFAYTRHGNYFGELFLWWTIYAFTLSSQYSVFQKSFQVTDLYNYSCYSSIIMSILFYRSSKLSENLTSDKYPEYKHYQSKVNRILPSLIPYVPKKHD